VRARARACMHCAHARKLRKAEFESMAACAASAG